jgi:hypothetical protein
MAHTIQNHAKNQARRVIHGCRSKKPRRTVHVFRCGPHKIEGYFPAINPNLITWKDNFWSIIARLLEISEARATLFGDERLHRGVRFKISEKTWSLTLWHPNANLHLWFYRSSPCSAGPIKESLFGVPGIPKDELDRLPPYSQVILRAYGADRPNRPVIERPTITWLDAQLYGVYHLGGIRFTMPNDLPLYLHCPENYIGKVFEFLDLLEWRANIKIAQRTFEIGSNTANPMIGGWFQKHFRMKGGEKLPLYHVTRGQLRIEGPSPNLLLWTECQGLPPSKPKRPKSHDDQSAQDLPLVRGTEGSRQSRTYTKKRGRRQKISFYREEIVFFRRYLRAFCERHHIKSVSTLILCTEFLARNHFLFQEMALSALYKQFRKTKDGSLGKLSVQGQIDALLKMGISWKEIKPFLKDRSDRVRIDVNLDPRIIAPYVSRDYQNRLIEIYDAMYTPERRIAKVG